MLNRVQTLRDHDTTENERMFQIKNLIVAIIFFILIVFEMLSFQRVKALRRTNDSCLNMHSVLLKESMMCSDTSQGCRSEREERWRAGHWASLTGATGRRGVPRDVDAPCRLL